MQKSFDRLRRYRTHGVMRDFFQDTFLTKNDFIIPLFVHEKDLTEQVPSMPFVYRYGPKQLCGAVEDYLEQGFPYFMLFPVIENSKKELTCQAAFDSEGLMAQSVKMLKERFPQALFIVDIALDPYHPEGQDGLLDESGDVDNDSSLIALCEQALTLTHAGADMLAPSDMMDGRVQALREALDQRGLIKTPIASYTLKFCSHFYGPFRDAVGSKDCLGTKDKKTYQMAFDSSFQVEKELQADIDEGADALIIKPSLAYLDLIEKARYLTKTPLWTYHVSGECALLYWGAQKELVNFEQALYEQLIAMKRAGAHKIITYLAPSAKPFLLSS